MGQLPSLAKRSGSRLLFPPRLARLYRLRALESPIHAFRIEPAAARPGLVSQVDDAQDLLRGSVESDPVRIGGHEVRLAVAFDALVLVARPIELIAGGRQRVRRILSLLAHLVELRARHAHVISLDRQNAGCRLNKLLLLQDRRGAGVSGDADILEQHPAEKEVHVVGEGVELGKSRTFGCSREPGLEINRRTADRLAAERLAAEADMRELVLSQLFGEFANRLALEVDLTPTFDVAGIGAGIGCIDAFARGGAQIILGFHVLEIERELENVLVLDVRLVPCPETHRRWHTGLR